MNRTQLNAFAAVAEAGGFSRGAERLMVSQPAVSLQVAELEAALQTRLFDRLPRGVRLTAAGELLLGYARRIAALETEAEQAVGDLAGLRRGRLVLGASLTIGSYLLPTVLGAFRAAHPNIDLDLQIANTSDVAARVRDGQIELGFTEGPADHAELVSKPFHSDRLVPVCRPDHPILSVKRVTAALLCREPLVLREPGSGTRAVVELALARKRITVQPVMSLGSIEAVKRAVQAGIGLAIVSELAITAELAAGTLAEVAVVDLNIRRPLHRVHRKGHTESAAAVALSQLLDATVAGSLAGSVARTPAER